MMKFLPTSKVITNESSASTIRVRVLQMLIIQKQLLEFAYTNTMYW
jgi:hypothetical protein